MSNLTDFFPSGGGGGLTPKFKEFNSSGTFAPSQALIDAGGYIEVFLVGGGCGSDNSSYGGSGGEVLTKRMYLSSTSSCSVSIGAGGINGSNGGNTTFSGSSAGGVNATASGGVGGTFAFDSKLGGGWPGYNGANAGGAGAFGYGSGGAPSSSGVGGGVKTAKANSGQGAVRYLAGGSGYCLIKWYE